MPKIDESIIKQYQALVESLPDVIKTNKLNKEHLSDESGIKRTTLFRKLKSGSFLPDEVERLVKAINQ